MNGVPVFGNKYHGRNSSLIMVYHLGFFTLLLILYSGMDGWINGIWHRAGHSVQL